MTAFEVNLEKLTKLYSVPNAPDDFYKNHHLYTNWKEYTPYKSIREIEDIYTRSSHWGQLKLMLTEICFLSLFSGIDYSSTTKGTKGVKVIYAGAAPSDHIEILVKYFPKEYHYDLVDPEKWNQEFVNKTKGELGKQNMSPDYKKYTINEQIDVYHGFFTDELANTFAEKYKDDQVIFLSDIRPTNIEELSSTIEERNRIVNENMEMQRKWYEIIKTKNKFEVWGMFKFKPTFDSNITEYLDGYLFYQPWAPLKSPELRLITNSLGLKKYDNKWLEEHLVWFNEVRRNSFDGEYRDPLLNNMFDTTYMYDIIELLRYIFDIEGKNLNVIDIMSELCNKLCNNNKIYLKDYKLYDNKKLRDFTKLLNKIEKYNRSEIQLIFDKIRKDLGKKILNVEVVGRNEDIYRNILPLMLDCKVYYTPCSVACSLQDIVHSCNDIDVLLLDNSDIKEAKCESKYIVKRDNGTIVYNKVEYNMGTDISIAVRSLLEEKGFVYL